MKNHGNAPTSAQYAEFSGIVQSKLWPAVKGRLSQEEIQALITGAGPEEVLKRLRKAFVAAESGSETAPHSCPFFAKDETESAYDYPPDFSVKPVAEQLIILSKHLPYLDGSAALAHSKNLPPPPDGAEGPYPYVVPKWRAFAHQRGSYGDAVGGLLNVLLHAYSVERHVSTDELRNFLHPSARTMGALDILGREQDGDYLLLWAQFGRRHRGKSPRRTRITYAPREFGLGAFEAGAMLLTHQERLTQIGQLAFSCPGDEYRYHNNHDMVDIFLFRQTPTFFSSKEGEIRLYFENDSYAYPNSGPVTAFLPNETVAQ